MQPPPPINLDPRTQIGMARKYFGKRANPVLHATPTTTYLSIYLSTLTTDCIPTAPAKFQTAVKNIFLYYNYSSQLKWSLWNPCNDLSNIYRLRSSLPNVAFHASTLRVIGTSHRNLAIEYLSPDRLPTIVRRPPPPPPCRKAHERSSSRISREAPQPTCPLL